jgi:hypothetical protein
MTPGINSTDVPTDPNFKKLKMSGNGTGTVLTVIPFRLCERM